LFTFPVVGVWATDDVYKYDQAPLYGITGYLTAFGDERLDIRFELVSESLGWSAKTGGCGYL